MPSHLGLSLQGRNNTTVDPTSHCVFDIMSLTLHSVLPLVQVSQADLVQLTCCTHLELRTSIAKKHDNAAALDGHVCTTKPAELPALFWPQILLEGLPNVSQVVAFQMCSCVYYEYWSLCWSGDGSLMHALDKCVVGARKRKH